jgi:hypothetical protein
MAPRKTLQLDQVILRYGLLDDATFIKKVFGQIVSQSVNHKHKLSPQTVTEYSSSFNTLVRHIEAAAGSRRASLPSLAELVLRAHGPQTVRTLVNAPSLMRKIAIVACAIVCRAFPELNDDDRQAASATWQAALRLARQQLQAQIAATGYSGNLSADELPTWHAIQAAMTKLQPGSAAKLVLLLYTLPFRGAWATSSELLNFGHVRVYRPSEVNQAPTHEQMRKMAADESKPRGWLLLGNNTSRPDCIYLVVGTEQGKSRETECSVQHHRLPSALRDEVRQYVSNRPAAQHFQVTSQKVTVNITAAEPYVGAEGRASFLAWVNRQLFSALGCRLRQYRAAVALHHRQNEAKELAELDSP